MSVSLQFRVIGEPAAQGSKKYVGNGVMVESSKKVKPWRQDVVAAAVEAAQRAGWQPLPEVRAVLIFGFRRPQSHYRTGRNAHLLRDNAPTWHTQKPDADKLARSTLDALTTAGVIGDDCKVAQLVVLKTWTDRALPAGAVIRLCPPIDRQPEGNNQS